jgi:hypothetical protein
MGSRRQKIVLALAVAGVPTVLALSRRAEAASPVALNNTFHLEVNVSTGDVSIWNDSTSSAPFTLYNIVDSSLQDLIIGNPADGNGTSDSLETGSAPYTNEHFLSVPAADSNAVASITGRSSTNYKTWSLVLDGYNSNGTALALSEGGEANKTDTINVPSYYSIDLGDIFNTGATTLALTLQWGTETTAGGEGGTVFSNQPVDYVDTVEKFYWKNSAATGNWSGSSNWSSSSASGSDSSGPPAAASAVVIANSDSLGHVVTLDVSNTIQSLQVGSTGGGTDTLSQTSGNGLTILGGELVGLSGGAGIYNQSAGTNTIGGALIVGDGGAGTYNLSGTGAITESNFVLVGSSIAGTFNQSGGSLSASGESIGVSAGTGIVNQSGGFASVGELDLGAGVANPTTGAGSYFVTGGSLSVGNAYVGGSSAQPAGNGTLSISANAKVSVSNILTIYSTGTVLLSGGTLQVGGLSNIGDFAWASGTLAIESSTLTIGSGVLGNNLTIGNGQALDLGEPLVIAGNLTVNGGQLQESRFSQTSGTFVDVGTFSLQGNGGTYTLSGGTLSVSGSEAFGFATFSQSNGTNIVGGALNLSASGVYNLGGGTLQVGTLSNSGSFNWTGGTINLTASSPTIASGGVLGASVSVGSGQALEVTGSGQSLNIAGGTLALNGGGLYAPSIVQSSGTFSDTGTLIVSATGGNAGSYNLSGGLLSVTGAESIGAAGSGSGAFSFSQTNGINNIAGTLSVASGGTYSLSGGTLSASALAVASGGSVLWSGGTLAITGPGGFTVDGSTAGALGGSLSIGGGQALNVSNTLYIGNARNGTFGQSAGTVMASSVFLGYAGLGGTTGTSPGGAGTYTLSGGSLNSTSASGEDQIIGYYGNGTFNQSGGTNNVSPANPSSSQYTMILGYQALGTYNLSAGMLNDPGWEDVGLIGAGTFNQTGGTHAVGYNLSLAGNLYSSEGTYLLRNSATLSVAGDEYIGEAGLGSFLQSGGSNTLGSHASPGNLYVGGSPYFTGGVGTYSLSGGSLTVSGDVNIGGAPSSPGTVLVSGSSVANIAGNIWVGGTSGGQQSTGTLTVGGGSITASSLTVYGGSSFTQSGGSIAAGSVTIASGGTLSLSGGTLSAPTSVAGNLVTTGSPLLINMAGAFTLTSTATTLAQEIGSTHSFADVQVNGSLMLAGTLSLYADSASEALSNSSQSFILFDTTNGGVLSGSFANVSSGQTLTTTDGTASYLVTIVPGVDGFVELSGYTPVPEPTSAAVVLSGGYLMLRRRRGGQRCTRRIVGNAESDHNSNIV